jgi:hypothetical protein
MLCNTAKRGRLPRWERCDKSCMHVQATGALLSSLHLLAPGTKSSFFWKRTSAHLHLLRRQSPNRYLSLITRVATVASALIH